MKVDKIVLDARFPILYLITLRKIWTLKNSGILYNIKKYR